MLCSNFPIWLMIKIPAWRMRRGSLPHSNFVQLYALCQTMDKSLPFVVSPKCCTYMQLQLKLEVSSRGSGHARQAFQSGCMQKFSTFQNISQNFHIIQNFQVGLSVNTGIIIGLPMPRNDTCMMYFCEIPEQFLDKKVYHKQRAAVTEILTGLTKNNGSILARTLTFDPPPKIETPGRFRPVVVHRSSRVV